MNNDSIKKIVYGLEKRECTEQRQQDNIVIDGYVPKASGTSVVDRIKNMYTSPAKINTYFK